MKTRTIVVLLVLGVALLLREALAGRDAQQVVASTPGTSPAAPVQGLKPRAERTSTTTRRAQTTSSAPTTTTTTTTLAPEHGFHDHEGEARETIEDYWAGLPDPANSDLAPEVFEELTNIGREVVTADVTTEGRDKYPEFFGNTPGKVWFQDFVIHSAGARSTNGMADAADVTVVWSATPIFGGAPFDHHTSIVHLALRDGRWVPEKLLS